MIIAFDEIHETSRIIQRVEPSDFKQREMFLIFRITL